MPNQKSQKISVLAGRISNILTIIIVAMLIISGPSQAMQIKINTDNLNNLQVGGTGFFYIDVTIGANERIPIANISVENLPYIEGSPDGSLVFNVSDFRRVGDTRIKGNYNISLIYRHAPFYGYGYGYQFYSYGYGYGYGYGYSDSDTYTKLKYKVTVNTTGAIPGKYDVVTKVHTVQGVVFQRSSSFTLTPAPIPPPAIVSSSPPSQVMDVAGATRTFSITANQTVNVIWYINGTAIFNETSVTTSTYTNTSTSQGTWNITSVAGNANGTAMQTWDWIVIPTSTEVSSISGFKINDINGNGMWDADEAGLSGWKINLRGIERETRHIKKETFTDATGFYRFDDLPAGRYIVMEKLKKGFVPIGSPVKVITLAEGESSMNNNFTNRPVHRIFSINDIG